jgi:hypothetical protein
VDPLALVATPIRNLGTHFPASLSHGMASAVETGLRLCASLDGLLESLPAEAEGRLVEQVSRCFGRGHPVPEVSSTAGVSALLHDFVRQLRKDPTRRQIVVDRDSLVTDDAGWLTAAKHSAFTATTKQGSGVPPLQWAITTVRSLERGIYDHCYAQGWRIQHATGPRGSAVVTKRGSSSATPSEVAEDDEHPPVAQAFFSDVPKYVVTTGRQLAALYPGQIVLRVLRAAPRASLTDGLTGVVQQQEGDSVFTLWIRHHERVDLTGMGRYRFATAKYSQRSVLDLLTAFVDEETPRSTSPVAHDFSQASQAGLQRCRTPSPTLSPPPLEGGQAQVFRFATTQDEKKTTEQDDAALEESTGEDAHTETTGAGSMDSAPLLAGENTTDLSTLAFPLAAATTSPQSLPKSSLALGLPEEVGTSLATTLVAAPLVSDPEIVDPMFTEPTIHETKEIPDEKEESAVSTHQPIAEEERVEETTFRRNTLPPFSHTVVESALETTGQTMSVTPARDQCTELSEDVIHEPASDVSGTTVRSTVMGTEGLILVMTSSPDVVDETSIVGEKGGSSKMKTIGESPHREKRGPQQKSTVVSNVSQTVEGTKASASVSLQELTELTAASSSSKEDQTESKTSKDEDGLATSAEASSAVSYESSTVPPSLSSCCRSPSRNAKKCTGCGTKKPKTSFSNSQLKKKRNARCMECVRSNRLGAADN